ncbi:MAG: XRE family transcriptional regulator [Pseudomonadota bacterium]
MEWQGEKLKKLAKDNKLPLSRLAGLVGVSRQTANDWVKGQIPKGIHLISLCKIFSIMPDYFFVDTGSAITIPVHRKRLNAKITPELQKDALSLAREYEFFFRNESEAGVVPVIRTTDRSADSAKKIAIKLREFSGVGKGRPLDLESAFNLLVQLGIKVVFRKFTDITKVYAFYTKIYGHRVIFVNTTISEIDIIFALIHEAVHAIRDEVQVIDGYDAEEEGFCDLVANHVQFPDEYVVDVSTAMKGLDSAAQVILLKNTATTHRHALYGIVLRLEEHGVALPPMPSIGGANTNLRKKFNTLETLFFEDSDPRKFVAKLRKLSPLFVSAVVNQLDHLPTRKLGELFGVDDYIDADSIKQELIKIRGLSEQ